MPMLGPRPTGSRAAIWASAASFGAPVTDPPGQTARSRSARSTPSRRTAVTRDSACHRWHQCRTANSDGTVDRPGLRDLGEVVALQVDDHDVLGPFLGGGEQLAPARRGGRAGALDRPGLHHAAG